MFRLFDAINLAIIVALTAMGASPAFAQVECTNLAPCGVPEPASLALLAVGVGGVLYAKRRSRR